MRLSVHIGCHGNAATCSGEVPSRLLMQFVSFYATWAYVAVFRLTAYIILSDTVKQHISTAS